MSVPAARAGGPLEPARDGLLACTTTRSSLLVDPVDGARIVSLRIDGVEVLGRGEPAPGAPPGIFSGCFLMAPFAGRTAHGRFAFEGREHALPLSFPPHAIHGLAFDRPWRREGEELVLDLDERWPFGGSVRQRFELGETGLTVTATILNEERTMPAIAGFHPWFVDPLADGSRLAVDFRPGTRYVCDPTGIPVGTVPGGGDRPWDDSFADVAEEPVVRWENGLELRIGLTGSHWIVCETVPGAVCIEPLSGPVNGLATGGHAIVGPGRPLVHRLALSWD